jgi:uroporphyrinogen decarboxylase
VNSLERVQAAVSFRKPDRIPVIPQIFAHAAVLAGERIGDYVRDGALLARCQIEACRHYGGDAVFAFMDAGVETEAMGSVIRYYDDQYPCVEHHMLTADMDVENLIFPDPLREGRMPELLRATTQLRAGIGDTVPVVGVVLGPMTLATQLMGIESTLELAIDDPRRLEKLLAFATELAIQFGEAQLRAGAHLVMVFDPSASTVVVPPQFFREFLMPGLGEIARAFKAAGAFTHWLHIAGPVEPILVHYPQTGAQIANLDFEVDPARAMEILPHTCLDGNIKPLLFVNGSAEQVAAEARRLVTLFAKRGGFILSSGCEIPPEAKPENIAAMVAVASEQIAQC